MEKRNKKYLTFEERKQIEKHIKNGLSCRQIAKLIGRSSSGVVTEVRRGGGKFYTAKSGQNSAEQNFQDKYRKLSERNTGISFSRPLSKRIENLEMQIEILHDTIKELLNR